jgi:pilus assembly protein CpaB
MKKKNLVTLLGIALVVALVATGVFYGLFVSNLKSNAPAGKTLVVAAKPLEAGRILTATDVKTVSWPAATVPKGAFENVDQVAGKTVFDAIGEADPLFESQLISQDGAGRSAGIPAGMRAVSVHVSDSSGVLAMLHAGHKVDVQVLVKRGKDASTTELRTALENMEVLSVSPKAGQSSQGDNLPVVTLLAKPAEADILALADSGARLRLTLRNPLDAAAGTRSSVSLNSIMQSGSLQ